jgi:hypothetical protein
LVADVDQLTVEVVKETDSMPGSTNPADSDAELPLFSPAPDVLAGSVLDDRAELPSQLPERFDEQQRLADQFWLDALLKQLLDPAEQAHREGLILNTMQVLTRKEAERHAEAARLTEESPRRSRPTRRVWMTSLASLAATVAIGLFLFWPETAPATALAAVERSLQAAAEDVDREYRVQITQANSRLVPPGTLTVRGANRYVYAQPGPVGVLSVGSNGKEFWLVPPVGPVRVAAEGSFVERMLSERQLSTPILNLTTELKHLRDRFELELMADEQIPAAEDAMSLVRCQHLRGRLQIDSEPFAPQTIEIWCERSTGVVQRMVMSWPVGSKSGMLQCDVQLQSTPANLPRDFYDPSTHRASQRHVHHGPAGDRDLRHLPKLPLPLPPR